ncbi:hypothetical protein GCM10010228_08750 [Streptomyces massasporeus]|nr:hypothetical protein GCM10010228_08750 [Streptomyces massasporeus]
MTAIPHPSGHGLYIPNMKIADQWDRADPIAHTRMALKAIEKVVFARTVRLLKHWNRTHSKPMCSWNIKALCLDCLDEPMSIDVPSDRSYARILRRWRQPGMPPQNPLTEVLAAPAPRPAVGRHTDSACLQHRQRPRTCLATPVVLYRYRAISSVTP